ncbi:unnamed protein product [Sphagnum jensenii]|uniref:TF-B3 domain-containing protein n=1 Tax=Sphagnum jensenii TaxID=128206 RepID=A0ABP1AJ42_9BRYO
MVTRAGGSFAAVPAMVDASVKRGASEEKTRISNLMDAVMTASGGRTRISVLMDAVMKASEADDADVFSEECCISHVLSSDAKKNLERSKKKIYSEGSLVPNEKSIMAKVRVQRNCKAQEIQQQQQQQQQLIQSLCPPTFTKTVLAGSLAASHSSGIWIPLEFMKDHGHQIGNEAVLQDEHGMTWEVSVSRGSWSGLRAGWKKFADNHTMAVGDKIEFSLIADSVFAVRIISETSQKPISHISRLCEDSHETVYKGISRKRSVRYVSSRSSNKTSHGSAFEDEADSHNDQFHAGIVVGTSSNSCKRARSKRCWKSAQAGIK